MNNYQPESRIIGKALVEAARSLQAGMEALGESLEASVKQVLDAMKELDQ